MATTVTHNGRTTTVVSESVEEFIEYGLGKSEFYDESQRSSRTEDGYDGGWHGTKDFARAVEVARAGWPEGAAKVAAIRSSLDGVVEKAVNARSQTIAYDYAGDYVDVGRHLSGEPECFGQWRESESAVASARVVRVCANTAVSTGVSQDSKFVRGAAILAAVDIIEGTGARVELWAVSGHECNGGKRSGQHLHSYTLLKRADQHLDLDRAAFALCHLGWQRRLQFAANERAGFRSQDTRPDSVACDDEKTVLTEHGRNKGDFSRDQLVEAVLDICRRAGVEIDPNELIG